MQRLILFSLLFCPSIALGETLIEQEIAKFLSNTCLDCHHSSEASGGVNLEFSEEDPGVFGDAILLERVIKQLTKGAMPPEEAGTIDQALRHQITMRMRNSLNELAKALPDEPIPLSRLNRFQYNNTIRDLFELSKDIYPLPEKLMDRHGDYLKSWDQKVAMPDLVRVSSSALNPTAGLEGVKAFPKDLRAEHGFDNQANQLTLSPLLLDSFFKLSVSIVDSPDFNPENVGVWDELFAEANSDSHLEDDVRGRLEKFLTLAFRRRIENSILDRYTLYALDKIRSSDSFTDGMKKVVAAALSSPMFLYRIDGESNQSEQYELASRLSYFLWASCPDEELLEAAERGELRDKKSLSAMIDRMILSPKIERFLDAFPVQWLQLENVLAATPNPKQNRFYSLNPEYPASLQMLLEPLLLFDMTFIENRSIIELISPNVAYQSDFLKTWYFDKLEPEPLDIDAMNRVNSERNQTRESLRQRITSDQTEISNLIEPATKKILADRNVNVKPLNLQPYAAWDFDGDLSEQIRGLELVSHGEITFQNGSVVLNRSYLQTKPFDDDFVEKSLEVRFVLKDLDQRGGGLMTVQGPGGIFDSIVIGERKDRHWISGSNGFVRTEDFPNSFPELSINQPIHLVMCYHEDGTTQLYRNGSPYGGAFSKGRQSFKASEGFVLFGLRHLPAGGNRYLNVQIDDARLYDRALTQEEVEHAFRYGGSFVTDEDLSTVMTDPQVERLKSLRVQIEKAKNELREVPENVDVEKAKQGNQSQYDSKIRAMVRNPEFHRTEISDPRYGGIMTNAATLTMTSGPNRTHPVARGVWVSEVIFNDPPSPPPNDIPPLAEDESPADQTIREKFAAHRENPTCAGCHNQLDPLGFALENYDITGRWRTKYPNGRDIDVTGKIFQQNEFRDVLEFKKNLTNQADQFAFAFTEHLMRYALARELSPKDRVRVRAIVIQSKDQGYPLRNLIRSVIESDSFCND